MSRLIPRYSKRRSRLSPPGVKVVRAGEGKWVALIPELKTGQNVPERRFSGRAGATSVRRIGRASGPLMIGRKWEQRRTITACGPLDSSPERGLAGAI